MPETIKINGIKCAIEFMDSKTDSVRVGYKVGSTVKELTQSHKADVAINFNFAKNTVGQPIGRLIVNGKEVNSDELKTYARDEFYMHDGKFIIGKAPTDAQWAVQGSPVLLSDGKDDIDETIKRDQTGEDIWKGNAKRIRTAVGIINANKAVIVRTYDAITLNMLMQIMRSLGCIEALNGDGGGSAYMWPVDNGWGRKMGSALLINKGVYNMPDLIIDAGHGGSDPGASGNGIIEKNMTLNISLYQFERFKQLGVNVVLTRDKDAFIGSTPRANIVKNSGAKICISNHINSASATSAKGAEATHSISNSGELAKAIVDKLKEAGQVLRPTATFSKKNDNGKDYYYMHRQTGAVATTIVEYGFCSNFEDSARLKTNWKVYAEAVVKAYCEFTGVKYIAPVIKKSTEAKPAEPKPITPPPNANAKIVTYTDATLIIDGKEVDVKGMNVNGTVWLPVRKISEPNGYDVRWDGPTQTVYLNRK